MKKALIELKGISKNFAGVKALQDVDLTIYEGGNTVSGRRKRLWKIHID